MRMVAKAVLDSSGRRVKCFKNNLPSAEWARTFLKRHSALLTLRSCQNIKKVRAGVSPEEINNYFDNLVKSLKNEDGSDISPNCIYNYDETNLTDDPGIKKCIFKRGVKYPERIRDSTKTSISLMFCGSAAGEVIPPYVVYKADHLWNLWTEGGLKNVRYNRSKSGWFDATTFSDWFETCFLPHVKRLKQRVVLIGDNLASHFTESVIRSAEANNIAFVCLPKNSTHLCQPLDVAFYRPMKMKWWEILDTWKQNSSKKSTTIAKDKFPALLRQLCRSICGDDEEKLFSANVISWFRKCEIVPLNRDEVLRRLPQSGGDEGEAEVATGGGSKANANVSSAVIDHLKKMRYGSSEHRRLRIIRRYVQVS